ncbi:MAG TPA: enoyl-CoA hydratase-related protein [Syntrophomonadaceae bacterium]|nr:enoyl-CoA hydratase-related protein [Syntrophomonadaceae bacterium]
MAYENIILEKEDYLAVLYVNRPKALNALNKDTLTEIRSAIQDVAADQSIKVMIVTGAGDKAFVAGADIAYMQPLSAIEAREFSDYGEKTMRMFELLEKPVIAAIRGFALGGGCELAMACDIRLAADNALFAQPEVGLGVIPGFGGTQRLPRIIGEGRAKELTYTADTINAEEAYRIGLVNHVYPVDELMDAAKKLAKKIASKGNLAVGFSKFAIGKGLQADLDTAMSIESDMFGMCSSTFDQKEGMGAFLEKRKPVFQGK